MGLDHRKQGFRAGGHRRTCTRYPLPDDAEHVLRSAANVHVQTDGKGQAPLEAVLLYYLRQREIGIRGNCCGMHHEWHDGREGG
jgi:hypothetical protein